QAEEDLPIGRILEVEGDRALVPVDGLEVAAVAGVRGRREPARLIAAARLLDLEDVRAQVRQDVAGERTGQCAGQLEDADPREGPGRGRPRSRGRRHLRLPRHRGHSSPATRVRALTAAFRANASANSLRLSAIATCSCVLRHVRKSRFCWAMTARSDSIVSRRYASARSSTWSASTTALR